MNNTRRDFIQRAGGLALGLSGIAGLSKMLLANNEMKKPFFKISLAEWSFHKALFAGKMSNLDFPAKAKQEFGIDVVEYVNQFFKDKATDTKYLDELSMRCNDNGVTNHLIMCDGEGDLGAIDDKARTIAVENHYKWVDAASRLGCITIRVNAAGEGAKDDVATAAVDGLGRLAEFAAKSKMNVIVENHGGYSSDGKWLSGIMKQIGKLNVGTLPDFGNFCLKRPPNDYEHCLEEYDRYQGTKELMPYAKGVSAKTFDFDAKGDCVETDYLRMLRIIRESGFTGYMGIEYEGNHLAEDDGVRKTKELLLRVGEQLG